MICRLGPKSCGSKALCHEGRAEAQGPIASKYLMGPSQVCKVLNLAVSSSVLDPDQGCGIYPGCMRCSELRAEGPKGNARSDGPKSRL